MLYKEKGENMAKRIKYPIGIQTFRKIREEGYLYIDKTALVHKLVKEYSYVFLSRPRRFGKSLLVSTLQAYFEGKKELFAGLKIEKLEEKWTKYPVLRFDLSGKNYTKPENVHNKIDAYLTRMELIYNPIPAKEIGDRFYNLIYAAYQKTGQRVVILIDEYDKPMLDTMYDSSLLESIKGELRGFYSVLKECDEFIKFVMITGVSKFGKVSVFSGLNNLKDISMRPDYNDICGITEQEFLANFRPSLTQFAEHHKITVDEAAVQFKSYYDGYHFSTNGKDIYNPFSTLNAFEDNKLGAYWFESGSPTYLIRLLMRNHFLLQDLEGVERNESALGNIAAPGEDIVPLLYQSGYLTIKGYDKNSMMYKLGMPNREVTKAFWNSLGDFFFYSGRNTTEFNLNKFVLELESGDIESFMVRLRSMFASISNENESDKEVHFQNMITILVKMLGYSVRTEVHSSQGRSDIEIETPRYIYIFELKVNSTSEAALEQIKNKGYARQYEIDTREKILVGANFSPETRTFTGWSVERL